MPRALRTPLGDTVAGRRQAARRAKLLVKLEVKPEAPSLVKELVELDVLIARRAERQARAAAQAESRAKREARAKLKLESQLRREARAKLKAEAQTRRETRAKRKEDAQARRQARIDKARQKEIAFELKMAEAAARAEREYQWSLRKAQIKERKTFRVPYLKELRELEVTNPWKLVVMQQDIVEMAQSRAKKIYADARGARAVAGPDDPETMVAWRTLEKQKSTARALASYERKKLRKYTEIAEAWELGRVSGSSPLLQAEATPTV